MLALRSLRSIALLLLLMLALAAFGCKQAEKKAPTVVGDNKPAAGLPPAQTEDKPPAELPEMSVNDMTDSPSKSQRPLQVWTDPAIAPVLQALLPEFKKEYVPGFSLAFTDQSDLEDSLANMKKNLGGQAPRTPDVYIFSGKAALDALIGAGAVDEVSARTFAGDRLAVVCTSDKTYESGNLLDIYRLRFTHFGVADPKVSMLGKFSDEAIISDGLKPRLTDTLTVLPTVDDLLEGLRSKKLDLAIVYASTAAQTKNLKLVLLVDEGLHEDVQYKAVASKGRSTDPAVTQFLTFIAENPEVQKQYEAYGYVGRKEAMIEQK